MSTDTAGKSNWTIPNVISVVRLLVAPFAALAAWLGSEPAFITIAVVCLVSDIFDGWIARRFNLGTDLGVLLDSAADDVLFYSLLFGLFFLKREEIGDNAVIFFTYIALAVLVDVLSIVRFGRISSLHLYSFKLTGYVQGATLVYIFLIGFNVHIFNFAMLFGVVACLEIIAVTLILPIYKPNARGLYWVLRDRRQERTAEPGTGDG